MAVNEERGAAAGEGPHADATADGSGAAGLAREHTRTRTKVTPARTGRLDASAILQALDTDADADIEPGTEGQLNRNQLNRAALEPTAGGRTAGTDPEAEITRDGLARLLDQLEGELPEPPTDPRGAQTAITPGDSDDAGLRTTRSEGAWPIEPDIAPLTPLTAVDAAVAAPHMRAEASAARPPAGSLHPAKHPWLARKPVRVVALSLLISSVLIAIASWGPEDADPAPGTRPADMAEGPDANRPGGTARDTQGSTETGAGRPQAEHAELRIESLSVASGEPQAEPLRGDAAAEPKLTVESPEQQKPPARPARGRLSVVHRGGWAKVYLERRLLGTTPAQFQLPAGSHELTIQSGAGGAYKRTVEVRPRRTTRLILRK